MMKCHGLRNPLGCPLCEKTFSGKAIQRKHISSCQELPKPRRGKDFPCHKCDKKYVDQEALNKHLADHEGKVFLPVCQYHGKQLSTSGALKVHIETSCPQNPDPPARKSPKSKFLQSDMHYVWWYLVP